MLDVGVARLVEVTEQVDLEVLAELDDPPDVAVELGASGVVDAVGTHGGEVVEPVFDHAHRLDLDHVPIVPKGCDTEGGH